MARNSAGLVTAVTSVAEDASSAPESVLLQVKSVTKRFGGIIALQDVSMALGVGEICGLIGPNGAGKTTLFDLISGITSPSEGRVVFGGLDVTRLSASNRARLGMRRTFQRTQLFSWLSVEDNVLSALEWRGGGGGLLADLAGSPTRRRKEMERRDRVDEVIDWCGLDALRRTLAGALPLGQARIVELARAMVDRPKVLLLDEPTSGLDHGEAERFGELVRSVRGHGCAVLLVEHDVGFVMNLCERVVVLNLGSVLASGLPGEIRAHQGVRDAYLG
jgi:ABC-type branched-subunit amino acid transport system ATPase component